MNSRVALGLWALLSASLWTMAAGAAENAPANANKWVSESQRIVVHYESSHNPIVINRIHSWILKIEYADGRPVTGARVSVTGGMPDHDHGLPTNPQVTESENAGHYLVEGLRFHMNGRWQLVIDLRLAVTEAEPEDRVLITLVL